MNLLSEAVQRYRKDHNLSQTDFGKLVGLPQSAVSDLERCISMPGTAGLRALAGVMGWTIRDLGEMLLTTVSVMRRVNGRRTEELHLRGADRSAEDDHERGSGVSDRGRPDNSHTP